MRWATRLIYSLVYLQDAFLACVGEENATGFVLEQLQCAFFLI